MKRSNRLVLLVGVVLAVVAFGGVIVLFNQKQAPVSTAPTELPTVYAKAHIALGTVITTDMIEARNQSIAVRPTDAFGDVGQVVGQTVRSEVAQGQLLLPSDFAPGGGGATQDVAHLLDPGLRAIAVQVDQSTGVGTLINVGDRVDLVVGFSGADTFPVVQPAASPSPGASAVAPAAVSGLNPTSTKVILQNMQVIGTLVPPVTATTTTTGATGSSAPTSIGLTGQQELVILAVTPQQAEVIKFAQTISPTSQAPTISLVLRSPKDYVDAAGNPVVPPVDTTTGIVLKTLVDKYGVLPPALITLPTAP